VKDKYVRICWNTLGWRMPSGEAPPIEAKTYVANHGFGHEEWLFNFEWLINGYRYGFLQPIGKYYDRYKGKTCSILMYTITPQQQNILFLGLKILWNQESVGRRTMKCSIAVARSISNHYASITKW